MKYIEENENVQRVYKVNFDSEKLKELLNKVIRNAKYKVEDIYTAPYEAKFEGKKFTSGAELPNGDPMYENIQEIYRYTSNGEYSYYGDSIAVKGEKVFLPRLARIIVAILNNEKDSIYDLLEYANHEELIPMDEKIKIVNERINKIDNFDYDKKIGALYDLKRLCEAIDKKEYFDAELLQQYYLEARNLFELELVSEKTKNMNVKIKLKDYKPQNKK